VSGAAVAFLWIWSAVAFFVAVVLITGRFGIRKLLSDLELGGNGLRPRPDQEGIERRRFVVSVVGWAMAVGGAMGLVFAVIFTMSA